MKTVSQSMSSGLMALRENSLSLYTCTAEPTIAALVGVSPSVLYIPTAKHPASGHNTASMVGWSDEPFVAVSFNYRYIPEPILRFNSTNNPLASAPSASFHPP